MPTYILDANLIILAFEQQDKEAIYVLKTALNDENSAFAMTPLIRYEVLRGVGWADTERYTQLLDALNQFEEFDITREVSELAADLYRVDVHHCKLNNEQRNFDKRKFDIFHYCSAKVNQCELLTKDADLNKINGLYAKLNVI